MNRVRALKVVNVLLLVLLLGQALSGFGRQALSYEAFEILHEGGGIALVVCSAVHLLLNWNWIRASFLKRKAVS